MESPDLSGSLKKGIISQKGIKLFKEAIYTFYAHNKRSFAWRNSEDPYKVVISEIMLQQTQTERVKEKFEQFMAAFPTIQHLACAQTSDVIKVWQGLGYNRRALALHVLAQKVVHEHGGVISDNPEVLHMFKGIGPATAASICAFAFNAPTLFIETNIRAVFIHCFFRKRSDITDKEIMPLVEQTLDPANPREWYYALMDYGVMLKKLHKNPSRKSAHYSVQAAFNGSDRQIRGLILKMLVETPLLDEEVFVESIKRAPEKIRTILSHLEEEGFIKQRRGMFHLA